MKQVTVRFPEVGYERLVRLCTRYGVTIRGVFEAATLISLEDEVDPVRHDGQVSIWEVAARLERSPEYRQARRHRITTAMDDDVLARLRHSCDRFGVSQNAALALVVLPWPEDCSEAGVAYRRENLQRIIERARQLDFSHRTRATVSASV